MQSRALSRSEAQRSAAEARRVLGEEVGSAGGHTRANREPPPSLHVCGLPTEGPTRVEANRDRTYKTKEETEKSKQVYITVVGTLLLIAVVVPMLQYYGYTARD